MTTEADQPILLLTVARRMFVLVTVMVASTAFNAATFSVAAVLPQVQGALSATQDEVAWTVTFYILATAVTMPMTGWLVHRFGRAAVQFWSLVGFTVGTVMCGLAQSLDSLVFWRIVQGAMGAPLQPVGQSVLLDVFPRRQHGIVISIFGTTNTIGPVIGPTFAGWLAEYYGWRWGFFMILPIAVAATVAARFALPDEGKRGKASLDWIGFLSLSIAISAAQLVLSRGQRLDWFQSTEIIVECCVGALALYVFLAHSATAHAPFLSPRLILDKSFAIGLGLVTIFGMLNFTPMALLPPLLQNQLGFPDGLIGLVVSFRGLGNLSGSFASVYLQRLDPRVGMCLGFGMQIVSGLWLMSIDLNVGLWTLCANSYLQGLAVGLIWTPIVTTAFRTLEPGLRPEAISVLHLMRSIGSSFFISISVAEIVHATGANYARMAEHLSPYNKALTLPQSMGEWSIDTVGGIARIAREITRQAALIGYMNAFVMYTVVSVLAIPLCLMLGGRRKATT